MARRCSAIAGVLLLAGILAGCESIGAPDAYRTQVCGAIADLSGPLVDSTTALVAAETNHDTAAAQQSLATLRTAVDRMSARLVDVPLWISGVDVTTDLRAIAKASTTALDGVTQAVAAGDQAKVDAAVTQLQAARLVSPGLGEHLRTARLAGLNC